MFASTPETRLDFIDVARAYLHAKARRDVHVDLPKEDHQEETRGKLKTAMYGGRDATQTWELELTETMVEAGFTQGS